MLDAILDFNRIHERHPLQSLLITDLIQKAVFTSKLFGPTVGHGSKWQGELKATLKLLIPMSNKAANLRGYDGRGSSLLYWAVSLGRDEVVEYLLTEAWEDMQTGLWFDEEIITASDVSAFRPSDVNKK